ncbi:hypothetical protein LCGC14_0355710 [marine sediment metagenome]|uniref:Uncharacterized protein n=1 Tax=marine sediment metagenome TaxID=412755 RepID=A0A0F9TF05_9ZZZZ
MGIDATILYDSMEPGQQDMPREEFIKQVMVLTNPKSFKKDLGVVIKKKQEFRTRQLMAVEWKKKIDEAVR